MVYRRLGKKVPTLGYLILKNSHDFQWLWEYENKMRIMLTAVLHKISFDFLNEVLLAAATSYSLEEHCSQSAHIILKDERIAVKVNVLRLCRSAWMHCLDTLSNMCLYMVNHPHPSMWTRMFFPLNASVHYLRLVFWLSVATRDPFGVGLVEKVAKEKVNDRNGLAMGGGLQKKWDTATRCCITLGFTNK